ncbi:MAG: DUF1192 domain-containing protein [Alphaproteobacteria bacterium]|nr:DUF1192 family protein [Alphaproteobacteria bacterium]TAD86599.1 MAG: DUF1192 domain-containing protein [Alphaproteobacteria bacterium]
MDDDAKPPPTRPVDLQVLSVADLEALIQDHEREIARLRAAIAAKTAHRSGAEALFRR